MSSIKKTFVLMIICFTAISCGVAQTVKNTEVQENLIKVGMTMEEVESLLWVRSNHSSDIISDHLGDVIMVKRYRIKFDPNNQTPYLYKNNKLIGWGNNFLSSFKNKIEFEKEKQRKAEEKREFEQKMATEKIRIEQTQVLFAPYGFDVIKFAVYAKTNLKKGEQIDFGGIVPDMGFRVFKGKKYVEIKFDYLVTYNTIRISSYEAASMTFDNVVKKLAKQIIHEFENMNDLAGFIFNIRYTNKDFSAESESSEEVINEFVMNKGPLLQYANLDITNQNLIDNSIVLVDGERIALNLQFSK